MTRTNEPIHSIDAARLYVAGYSPTMYAVISALAGTAIGGSPRPYRSFSITSDGFVIAQPGQRESGDFLGTVRDFEYNISQYLDEVGLTDAEHTQMINAYARRVVDWRTYGRPATLPTQKGNA